jgi:hypothetical protein
MKARRASCQTIKAELYYLLWKKIRYEEDEELGSEGASLAPGVGKPYAHFEKMLVPGAGIPKPCGPASCKAGLERLCLCASTPPWFGLLSQARDRAPDLLTAPC